MKYKCTQNMIACRLDRGESLLASIAAVCEQEGVSAAGLSAIGAVSYAEIGLYKVAQRAFHANVLEGEYELVSLTGNVSRMEGRVYLHVHAAFADEYGELRGGHLKEAVVSATCEVFITRFDMDLDRRFDPETGLNILNLERSRKHD